MNTNAIIAGSCLASLMVGCASTQYVESSAVTSALDLSKTNRFAVDIIDTSRLDTAFSDDVQDEVSDELIEQLEENGFDYVGERSPEIRFAFRTIATMEAGYLETGMSGGETKIVESERRIDADGDVVETTTTRTVNTVGAKDPIYVEAESRIFVLDAVDAKTENLLWRGYTMIDDTALDEEKIAEALELLVERLEEEAT